MTKEKNPLLCFCNKVSLKQINECIKSNDSELSLAELCEKSGAGTGACGGSCKPLLRKTLSEQSVSDKKESPKNSNAEQKSLLPNDFYKAISLFNRRYYWEAHEELEKIWLEEHDPNLKLFYQGIIQASAAMYHVLNANPKGVLHLALKSQQKLTQSKVQDIQLEKLIESLIDFEKQAKAILGNIEIGFAYEKLPKIKISHSRMTQAKSSH